jgi:peptidoglycan hydrolase-like protein with peptidoglycan-binding domain
MNRFTYQIVESVAFRWIIIFDKGVQIYESEKDATSSDEILLRKAKIAVNETLSRQEGKDMMSELDKMIKVGPNRNTLTLTTTQSAAKTGEKISEYPICVQRFGKVFKSNSGQFFISGTGDYDGYQFYSNNSVKYPDGRIGNYTCNIASVVIDGVIPGDRYPGKLIKFGSKGKEVEKIQLKLGIKADGIFGGQTQQAVQKFQSENGLTLDGIVGPNTWAKLFPPTKIPNANSSRLDPTPSNRILSATPSVPRFNLPNFGTSGGSASRSALSTLFKKKLELLKLKILTKGIDITKYLLPDEQVALNFLREANPELPIEQLNLMIYGVGYNPNMDFVGNIKNTLETIKNSANNIVEVSRNAGQRLGETAQGAFQQLSGSLQSIPGQVASSLNIPGINQIQGQGSALGRQLIGNLTLQGQNQAQQLLQLTSSGITQSDVLRAKANEILNKTTQKYSYDIQEIGDKYEVSIKYRRFDDTLVEIGKKTYPKDYKETVNGVQLSGRENLEKVLQNEATKKGFFGFLKEEPLIQSLISIDTTDRQIAMLKKDLDESFRGAITGFTSSVNRTRDAYTERWQELKRNNIFSPYPLNKEHRIYTFVKDKKEEMKKMINQFFSKQEEIFNSLITSLTQTSAAIPAITLIISTPPFNVPAAISLVSLVMAAINELVAKVSDILNYIAHLQNLVYYVSRQAYQELVRFINPAVELLGRLLDPISLLKKFMQKLLDAIKKLFKGRNCEKQIRRLKRLVNKKKEQVKKEKDKEEKIDLQEELTILEERLEDVKKNCGKGTSLEIDTKDLSQVLQEVDTATQQVLSVINESFVYDVQLPDGQTLVGISEEQFESLKATYRIIMQ